MGGTEKPHTDKYKEITNNWNYDASCTVTSLPVWDLENFKCLIFVVQSVHYMTPGNKHTLSWGILYLADHMSGSEPGGVEGDRRGTGRC
jgi:hypothetical protein